MKPSNTLRRKTFVWKTLDAMGFAAILALLVLCLSGCGTQVVYVPQLVAVTPPDALLLDCLIEPPPQLETYLKMTDDEVEASLTRTLNVNYGYQDTCNIGKSELREWKKEQLIIIEKKNEVARWKAGVK